MIRNITLSFLISLSLLPLSAQTAAEMFVSLPDSMLPYFKASERKELLSIYSVDPSEPAVMQNSFGSEVRLLKMNDDLIIVNTTPSTTWEISRLSDGKYCMLSTVKMPESETTCTLYDASWKKLSSVDFSSLTFTEKPDTMSQETYDELVDMIELRIVEAHFIDSHDEITLNQNIPFLTNDERKRVEAILLQRKLKWNGVNFK